MARVLTEPLRGPWLPTNIWGKPNSGADVAATDGVMAKFADINLA
jgi:hypothetical protein